jgi:hypothetical protein
MVDLMLHALVTVTLLVVGLMLIIDSIPDRPAPQRRRRK